MPRRVTSLPEGAIALDQPVGPITRLRLYPVRPLWSVGPGWAAVSGGLAVAGLTSSPEIWIRLILAWLLTDSLLGAVWDLGVGNAAPFSTAPARWGEANPGVGHTGIWHQLLNPQLPDRAPPIRLFPYSQAGSPADQLARRFGRLRVWWHDSFWPESGREFATLVAALGLALLLGAILGPYVLGLVLISAAASWLAVLSRKGGWVGASPQKAGERSPVVNLWHAVGGFGIPWLVGVAMMGSPSWVAGILGLCYAITYFGMIAQPFDFRFVGAGQAVAALLVVSLRHPLTAGVMAILLMPQWALCAWRECSLSLQQHKQGSRAGGTGLEEQNSALAGPRSEIPLPSPEAYLRWIQPFVVASMLAAALGIAP